MTDNRHSKVHMKTFVPFHRCLECPVPHRHPILFSNHPALPLVAGFRLPVGRSLIIGQKLSRKVCQKIVSCIIHPANSN
jgi:hypothetical protein